MLKGGSSCFGKLVRDTTHLSQARYHFLIQNKTVRELHVFTYQLHKTSHPFQSSISTVHVLE